MRVSFPLRSAAASATRRVSLDSIPVFSKVSEYRAWRAAASKAGQRVGFVPTMGALHQGHLDLVSKSLDSSPLTVLSIFVNPSQFGPTEDLDRYPRTLPKDLAALSSLLSSRSSSSAPSSLPLTDSPLVVFAPTVSEMYPSGITTVVNEQKGAFVEVKGYGDMMEGAVRPGFFRGVATVVTKLFNIVQPDVAHFGQKDIQQALLLRIMLRDLHNTQPSASNLIIHPTTRAAPPSNLALSSRNAYLTPEELASAPVLHRALSAAKDRWAAGATSAEMQRAALDVISAEAERTNGLVQAEYIEVFGEAFDRPEESQVLRQGEGQGWIVAGAMKCGTVRLIDNLLLDVELGGGSAAM